MDYVPITKKEFKNHIKEGLIQDIKIKGKRAFCTHETYCRIVLVYPEVKKYFIFQLELDF